LFTFDFGFESDSGAEERGESEETIALLFVLAFPFPFPFDFDLGGGSRASSSSSEDSSITSLDGTVMFEFRHRVGVTVWIALAALIFVFRERIFARSAMLDGISILDSEKFEVPVACTWGERLLEEPSIFSALSFFL
jgi:hypothetical protein